MPKRGKKKSANNLSGAKQNESAEIQKSANNLSGAKQNESAEIQKSANNSPAETQTKIYIGTFCPERKLPMEYVSSIMQTKDIFEKRGISVSWCFSHNKYFTDSSKNSIIHNFLEDKSATHLLMISPEYWWQPETIARLLNHDKDMVCAPCPSPNFHWDRAREIAAKKGVRIDQIPLLITDYVIDATGAKIDGAFMDVSYAELGFSLFKRAAIEKFVEKKESGKDGAPIIFEHKYIGGVLKSEDELFCAEWRENGGLILVDMSARIGRLSTQIINSVLDLTLGAAMVPTEDQKITN